MRMNDSPTSKASLLQRRIYGTLGLTVLVGLYLLVGLTGHDPWRGDDARHLGPVISMLSGEGWLFPLTAGTPLYEYPPLYYWTAALLAWLSGGLLAPHEGARLASVLFTALGIYLTARTAEALYGRPARTPAALLTLGTLGLVIHSHETQPLLALFAMLALTLRGLARVPAQPLGGSLQAGLGSALAFLAVGLPGALLTLPLFPLATLLSPDCRSPRASGGLLLGLTLTLTLGALWPLAVHLAEPAWFTRWLGTQWLALQPHRPGADELGRFAELLGWFTWPLWPIALWALWRERRRIAALPLLLPGLSLLLVLGWLLLATEVEQSSMIPLVPPVALLAACGVPTLRRGAANAFDWFALMTFGVFAILVWLGWTAQAFGWPTGLARHVARVGPDFVLRQGGTQLALGLLICAVWFGLVWRLPRTASRGPASWAMGMTMLWCLAVVLLMPWFDHSRSYRPMVRSLELALAGEAPSCIAAADLPDGVRASLDYFGGIRTVPVQGNVTPCALLLRGGGRQAAGAPIAAEWQIIWEYRHGGGRRQEIFRLYRRSPA